ncbi:MAG: molecular chaperone [Hyphomonadaceae bacterium]
MRAGLLLLCAMFCGACAFAQTAGVQIAPVMVTLSPDHAISSLRLQNGRGDRVAFEAEAFAWRQDSGDDVLTPTADLVIAPGVFEIPAGGQQIVRLGVIAPAATGEQAFRILLRELPRPHAAGARLGFTLEMSLPVFVRAAGAAHALEAALAADGRRVILTNRGAAHAHILHLADQAGRPLGAPRRYLLAGASMAIAAPGDVTALRIVQAEALGGAAEQVFDVAGAPSRHRGP